MFPNPTALWIVAQEIQQERMRQARREQQVHEAYRQQRRSRAQQPRLYRRWLWRLGALLVATGQRLQSDAAPVVARPLAEEKHSFEPLSCC